MHPLAWGKVKRSREDGFVTKFISRNGMERRGIAQKIRFNGTANILIATQKGFS
jgi:hypothetical protein